MYFLVHPLGLDQSAAWSVTATPRVSVVVPAYREAHCIGPTVEALRSELESALSSDCADDAERCTGAGRSAGRPRAERADGVEVVVVDDGSDDGTDRAAREAGADVVLRLPDNSGKGAAVRAGVMAASGRVVAVTDADLAYPPHQITRMLAEAEAGADMVIGNRRHLRSTELTRPSALRSVGSRIVNSVVRALKLTDCQDTQCGMKAFRRDAAEALFTASVVDGFAFDVELLYLADRYGMNVSEVPVEVVNSADSTVQVLRHGLLLLRDLAGIRLRAMLGNYPASPPVPSSDAVSRSERSG